VDVGVVVFMVISVVVGEQAEVGSYMGRVHIGDGVFSGPNAIQKAIAVMERISSPLRFLIVMMSSPSSDV
jgi:hypothetical protein